MLRVEAIKTESGDLVEVGKVYYINHEGEVIGNYKATDIVIRPVNYTWSGIEVRVEVENDDGSVKEVDIESVSEAQ